MGFDNEATYLRATHAGGVPGFHSQYDKALERVEAEFGETHPVYIDGKEVHASSTFADRSPSDTERVLGHFQQAGRDEAGRAVKAALRAFPDWAETDWRERVDIFRRGADLLSGQKFDLAALMSHENGKNRAEAMADVDEAIDLVRWYAHVMEEEAGFEQEMGRYLENERSRSLLKPYGVWGVISPFNFPLAIAAGMTTGAVLTGNTAVLKPASDTPFMAVRLYQALREAGLPDGVLNLVTGPGRSVGAAIVENPDVSGLIFTGSREVGLLSFRAFTGDFPKPVITELGGKNPVIVSEHADLGKAVPGVALGAFGYGGQKCSATSRVYVHRTLKEDFLQGLVEFTEGLRVGDPTDPDVYMGPLINEKAYRKYQAYVDLARQDGTVLVGGQALTEGPFGRGYFVAPTVVDGLPEDHRLLREELFVPFLDVAAVDSLEEGIARSNGSEYGLTAGIFTEDPEERVEYFRKVRAGVVYANREQGATTGAVIGTQPFVGWKHSGISGKGAGGLYYLLQFLQEQSQTYYV
ncbi:MAG: aldehyde dehydrogenase family protein [Candidatus Thermoplasmatota archaeon]|nr:aldehyde dehydrogenase family protein [Candidatus Thermoplasmatota archaeon]